MVNEGRERLLPTIYGSFESRIPLEEDGEFIEDSVSVTVQDLYQRSGTCSPRLEEVWSSDRRILTVSKICIPGGRGHSKKLSSTSNISVDSGLVHDEGIVRIDIPAPVRDEPKFPPEKMKTLYSFLFCVFSWFLTTITLALVHERLPDRANTSRLPDTFLDNVPETEWALDISEIILVVSGLSCVLLICFHRHRFIVVRRIFFLLAVLYLFRCLTMYVTVLPVASKTYYCSPKSGHASPSVVILRAVRMLVGMGLSINGQHTYCGDYIYSGHTVILTMACLIFQEYTPRRCFLIHWAAFFVTTSGVIFLMVSHGHYSVDVILAYYITTRLFWIYHTMANNGNLKTNKYLYAYLTTVCLFLSSLAAPIIQEESLKPNIRFRRQLPSTLDASTRVTTDRNERRLDLETSTIDITKLPGYWIKDQRPNVTIVSAQKQPRHVTFYSSALVST